MINIRIRLVVCSFITLTLFVMIGVVRAQEAKSAPKDSAIKTLIQLAGNAEDDAPRLDHLKELQQLLVTLQARPVH